MIQPSAQFGDLRALLQKPPSWAHWLALCDMVDGWSDPEHWQHIALPYTQDILDRTWPDVLRQAPLSWLARLLKGEAHVPGFELVRRLGRTQHYVSNEPCIETFPTLPTEDLCDLLKHPHMAHLTQLNLRNLPMHADRVVQTLVDHPTMLNLRALNLGATPCQPQTLRALWDSPVMQKLETLELWRDGLDDDALRALAASPHLKHLRRLELGDNQIGPEGVYALAHAPYIKGLTHLYLWNNKTLGDEGLQVLLDAPHIAQLEVLEVQQCGIGPEGAQALSRAMGLGSIKEIAISENQIKDEGARALLQSDTLGTLEIFRATNIATSMGYLQEHLPGAQLDAIKTLYLGGINSPLDAQSVQALAVSKSLAGLQELCISNMSCTLESLSTLARASWFARLHTLKLFGRFHWDDEPQYALAAVLKSVAWTHLHKLHLAGLDLTQQDIQAMAQNQALSTLKHLKLYTEEHVGGHIHLLMDAPSLRIEHLELQHCRLKQTDVEAITHSPHAQALRTLDLSHNHLSTRSVQMIAQSEHLTNLVTLRLRHCDLDTQSLWMLANATTFRNLRTLELDHNALPQRGLEFLAHTPHLHPDVRVGFEHTLRLRS